jgi:hypothetical protein
MTEQDLQVIRDIEAAIYKLPTEEQRVCDAMLKQFRTLIQENGTPAVLALALVGAEMQAQNP